MNTKGKITISKVHSGNGDHIEIRIDDVLSSVQFVTAHMSLENFAQAITAHGYIDCDFECRGLDVVGKRMEHETFEFELPETANYNNQKEIACRLATELAPANSKPDLYFGSKDSFFQRDGKNMARTTIRRWVDAGQETT